MFVSNNMIFQGLSKEYSCKIHKEKSYDLNLNTVEIAERIQNPQKQKIYVIDLHNFKENPKREIDLAVVIGTPKSSLINKCFCLIELPEDASVIRAMNAIMAVFEYYGKWEDSLRSIFLRGGSVKEMMDASAPIFGNPIGVHDATLTCVAETDYSDQAEEDRVTRHRKDPNYISSIIEDPDFTDSLRHTSAVIMTSPSNPKRHSLFRNIFFDGEFLYRIVITERCKKLDQQDIQLLELMASYIIPILTPSTWQTSVPTVPMVLERILSGEIQESQIVSRCFQARGWKNTDYYLCIVFDHSDIDIFANIEKAICQSLRQLMPNSEVFIYDKKVVSLINMGSEKLHPGSLSPNYAEFMRDMNMKCGVSSIMHGALNFRAQYMQACDALRIGQRLFQHFWQFYFDDMAPYYLMEQCTRELPVEAVCAAEILSMVEYDASHDTEYFQTAKEYLDCGMSLSRASERLFIHRATLIYRLKKIEELFRCDFKSPIKRVYYHFSIQMLSYTTGAAENLADSTV